MTNARSVHCPQHPRQVGVCPACQRARLAAEKEQLAEVQSVRRGDFHAPHAARRLARHTV